MPAQNSFLFRGSAFEVELEGGGGGALQDQTGSVAYDGGNGAGAFGWNGGSSTVSGGTGTAPADVAADAGNVWGPTSTIEFFGGNDGGGGRSLDIGGPDGGSGGGAGGAGQATLINHHQTAATVSRLQTWVRTEKPFSGEAAEAGVPKQTRKDKAEEEALVRSLLHRTVA